MSENEKELDIQFDMPKNKSNVIKVIGVGGGGSNAINHMFNQGINGVDFVVTNTDAQALENSVVPTKVQLGVNLTEGLGAGANPDIGEQAALETFEELKVLLDSNTKMVFITAGMGGGTGTGAAPIIAKQSRDMDLLTVGIVTIPFKFEGKVRNDQAQIGVEKLRRNVDSLIVIDNNKLREVYGNLGFKSGFSKADEVLATAARGIAEVITHHYTQNIDLRDAKTVLSNSGTALMGSAEATGGNRAQEAIERALDSPLLNDNKITGSQNVLLLIVSGSEEITLDEIGEINDHIQAEAGHSANIIMGVGEDEDLGESIAVTIIATGFDPEQQSELTNTERKKIIHTLEDDQKAEQSLSPDQTSGTVRRPENTERAVDQPKKIVHTLEEEMSAESRSEQDNGMNLIATTDLIKELEVDYKEVQYDEEDFVFITDADDQPERDENPEDSRQKQADEKESMIQFDLPKPDQSKRSQQSSTDKTFSNFKSSPQSAGEPRQSNRNLEDQVDLFPGASDKGETKRYSLEDYMEKERELTDAKPEETKKEEPHMVRKQQSVPRENEDAQSTEESEGEVDPLNSPISKQLISRASERRNRLKKFNYKFRKNKNIDEIEKQPAYKRAGVDLDNNFSDPNRGNDMSRSTIQDNDDDQGPQLRSNNSFLHDNVD